MSIWEHTWDDEQAAAFGDALRARARALEVTDRELAAQFNQNPKWLLQQVWCGKSQKRTLYENVKCSLNALAAWKASEPHDFKALADKLDAALKNTAWTQTELASRMDLTPRIIRYVLRGKSKDVERYLKVASALGLPIDWTDPSYEVPEPDTHEITEEERITLGLQLAELPITQRELAAKLGVSASWISSVLHGRVRTRRAWLKLQRAISHLTPGAPPGTPPDVADMVHRIQGLERLTEDLASIVRESMVPATRIISTQSREDGTILAYRSDGRVLILDHGEVSLAQDLTLPIRSIPASWPARSPNFRPK